MSPDFTFLDNLNVQQREACLCKNNVLLTACPGSGKTKTLTYRLAYLKNMYPESRLLNIAITYTNKAAEEISDRLDLLLDDTDAIWVGTIHQFCLNFVLYPYAQYSQRLSKGFRVINEWEQREMKELYKERYPAFLQSCKLIDFDDILSETLDILEHHPFISKNLSRIIRSISVDEYQDTQEIQYRILALIYNQRPLIQLFFVGDPNQAIYGSLGGIAKTVSELNNLYCTKFDTLTLPGCYRSTQKIIDFYRQFELNKIEIKSYIEDTDGAICFSKFVPYQHLPRVIAEIIKTEIQNGSASEEICLVAPQWRCLYPVVNSLRSLLPQLSFSSPQITAFKYDQNNLFYFFARILFTEKGRNVKRRLRWAKRISEILNEKYSIDITGNYSNLEILNLINRTPYQIQATTFFKKAFELFLEYLTLDTSTQKIILSDFHSYYKEITKRVSEYKFRDTTENFFQFFKPSQGILVDTIHGVKGKEFKTVIAFSLHEGKIPHKQSIKCNPVNARNDAKKLLYVLCSRAERNLFLFSECGIKDSSPTKELDESSFYTSQKLR